MLRTGLGGERTVSKVSGEVGAVAAAPITDISDGPLASPPQANHAPLPDWVLSELQERHRGTAREKIAPAWGLAFSGGGIRSATFCLGLARALAKKEVLPRFDYLSTVSGGGYIGSAIGRLYSEHARAETVRAGLADDKSLFLSWLRRNGRFLLPAGLADLWQAGVGYLRGVLATQWEAGVLMALLSTLIVWPHVAMMIGARVAAAGSVLGNPWWSLLLPLSFPAAALLFAFWSVRDWHAVAPPPGRAGQTLRALLSLLSVAVIVAGGFSLAASMAAEDRDFPVAAMFAVTVLAGVPAGHALAHAIGPWLQPGRSGPAQLRLHFTRGLTRIVQLMVGLLIVGALDVVSWILAEQVVQRHGLWFAGSIGSALALLVALRQALPAAQKFVSHREGVDRISMDQVAHWLGLLMTAAVLMLWLCAVQWFVFFCDPKVAWLSGAESAWARWLALVLLLLGYLLISRRNIEHLNRASLHLFYKSRLVRAYVSVGNFRPDAKPGDGKGAPRFSKDPLAHVEKFGRDMVQKVIEHVPGDDVPMKDYRPHDFGGPIHLVNVCVNQTRDDKTGTFSADRKGLNLAVSSFGMEFGQVEPRPWHLQPPVTDSTGKDIPNPNATASTLGQWVAISGAAVATGMGSITRTGVAALTFLSGARLGFWYIDKPKAIGHTRKYKALLREWLGQFPGTEAPCLYLSDGGHFDNTGVYALLKRRLEMIVVADCGADPTYAFADLENLIRKARIDYRTEIQFIDPASLNQADFLHLRLDTIGTPDSIVPEPGDQFMLIAKIQYPDRPPGAMLVVKPRRVNDLSIDVAGYSDRDVRFPQQTTGDQFFDEAQWESYCELGLKLGARISEPMLQEVARAARAGKEALAQSLAEGRARPSATVRPTEARSSRADAVKPDADELKPAGPSRRERIGPTVRQSLGIGAALTTAVAAWQGFDGARVAAQAAAKEEREAVDGLLKGEEKRASKTLIELALEPSRPSDDGKRPALWSVVTTLEDFGALHGRDLQQSVTHAIAEAVAMRCQRAISGVEVPSVNCSALQPAAPGGCQQEASPPSLGRPSCADSLAVLTPRTSSWIDAGLRDYQDFVLPQIGDPAAPAGTEPWKGCMNPSRSRVVLHSYDGQEATRLARWRTQIRELGLRAEFARSPELENLDTLFRSNQLDAALEQDAAHLTSNRWAAESTRADSNSVQANPGKRFGFHERQKREAVLLAHEMDFDCARMVRDYLVRRSVGQGEKDFIDVQLSPIFSSSRGEIQLVLHELKEVEVDSDATAPTTGDATASPSEDLSLSPGPIPGFPMPSPIDQGTELVELDEGLPPELRPLERLHTIYIQFQGSFTRMQVNDLRSMLVERLGSGYDLKNRVPGAERIGGRYPNVVKYFSDRDKDDAQALARVTQEIFMGQEIGACKLEPELEVVRAGSSSASGNLEIWISPICSLRHFVVLSSPKNNAEICAWLDKNVVQSGDTVGVFSAVDKNGKPLYAIADGPFDDPASAQEKWKAALDAKKAYYWGTTGWGRKQPLTNDRWCAAQGDTRAEQN